MSIYQDGRYLEHNKSWHAEFGWYKAGVIRQILVANAIEPATFVEVGCGSGAILEELSGMYPEGQFAGYDISPQAHAIAKNRENDRLRFFLGDFLQTSERFDCLLCIDVFEHVPDYMGFLEGMNDRADFFVFHIPLEINLLAIFKKTMIESRNLVGHLHYFNRDTALATLRDCGFEIVDETLTETFRLLPRPSLKNKLTGMIYRAVFALSPNLAVSLLGECSLLVLARRSSR